MSLVPVAALPLYPRLLGRSFGELDEAVRALHFTTAERHRHGWVTLRRGAGLGARLIARLLGWPPPPPAPSTTPAPESGELALRLEVEPRRGGETWRRSFGAGQLVTEQRALRGGLVGERFGLLELRARPVARGGALVLEAPEGRSPAALRLGPLCLPLPRALSPRLSARLWAPQAGAGASGEAGALRLRVAVTAPLFGLIVEYTARLEDQEGIL